MNHENTRVVRRLPVFEFAVQANLSSRDAENRLRLACASQNPDAGYPEPKWLGEDERLFGEVGGQVFRLTTGRGSGGSGLQPVILGYIVPESEESSTVIVRVRNPHWWSATWSVVSLICICVGLAEAADVRDAAMPALAVAGFLAGTVGYQIVEGNRILGIFSEILW